HCLTATGATGHDSRRLPVILPLFLYLVASLCQFASHRHLAQLRPDVHSRHRYSIPHWGPFRWVSCPHYLSEVTIYLSLLALSPNPTPLWLALVGFVCVNQTVAALLTHQWYRHRFGTAYPAHVRALVPYLL